MLFDVVAWLVVGLPVLVALHEATHVAVARLYGHPTVCVAINPIGVGVLFEDAPTIGYRVLQVVAPALVTWGCGYVWLAGLFAALAAYTPLVPLDDVLAHLPRTASLLTLLTSGADLVGGCLDLARPISGPARVDRGLASLRALPTVVLFTAYGRRHWRAAWLATAAGARIAPGMAGMKRRSRLSREGPPLAPEEPSA